MRGAEHEQSSMFSCISAEQRVPKDHPLRAIRTMTDAALRGLSPQFEAIYAATGRPSIAPEKLLRALSLQVLCMVRSARLLMEQLDYNFLIRGAEHRRTGVGRVCNAEKLIHFTAVKMSHP